MLAKGGASVLPLPGMGSHEEEQTLEIEALQSIFEADKEFESISDTEFLIKLVPYPAGEEVNHVGATLHVTYTSDYPDSPPDWDLEDVRGLPDEKVKALRQLVDETISSSLGMAMIYTVAEACQDYLKTNNLKALSMHEEMMQRMNQDGDEDEDDDDDDDDEDRPNEEEEWKGLAEKTLCSEADRITSVSFNEWKLRFDLEMVESGVLKREENKAKSGKQIFLAEKAPGDSDATPSADGGKTEMLVYDAALFGEDLDDLDDIDEGED